MDHQTPDLEHGPSPSSARVEDDLVQPLKPLRGISHRRLPAAIPFAIAGLLVVTSVAFGATFARGLVSPAATSHATSHATAHATPSPTTNVIGDDGPIDGSSPSASASQSAVTAPAPGELTITVQALPGKAKIIWSAYTGDDFAYYKVVRSTDDTVTWPLGGDDTLAKAISDQDTLTYTDCSGAGTFTYRVFAVKVDGDGFAVVAQSEAKTVSIAPADTSTPTPTATPTPTPTHKPSPTKKPVDTSRLGTIKVKNNGDGTYTFSWHSYKGSKAFDYYKLDGQTYPNKPGYAENSGDYWACEDNGTTTATVSVDPGKWNINVEAVKVGDGDPAVVARTSVLKLTVLPLTAPTVQSLTLTATPQDDGSVLLKWSQYTGQYFEHYGIVRTDGSDTPTFSVGETPPVYIDSQDHTSYVDNGHGPLGKLVAGQTYHYRVWAYTSQTFGDAGPACELGTVLGISNIADATAPEQPSAPTIGTLSLTATVQDDGTVLLDWSQYTGPYFEYYGIVRTTGSKEPSLSVGHTPLVYFDDSGTTSYTDDGSDLGDLTPGQTYNYRVYAYTTETFGDASAACEVGTVLAVSGVKTVTIPEK